jgi:MFS family permease
MDTAEIKTNPITLRSTFRAWVVWSLSTLFVILLFNFQTGYAIVNGQVQTELGLTLQQVGLVASVYTWAFAACQFFGGPLLDRLGSRMVLVPAAALVSMGIFVFSIADSFGMLVLSQLILAVGSCVGFVGAGYVGGQWFGMARYGVMFGLVQTVASLSSAFGQTGISIALNAMTWRELSLWTAWFGVATTILMAVFVRNPSPVGMSGGNLLASIGRNLADVAKIPHLWIAAFWGAVSFGCQLALGVVWASKLLAAHGIGPHMAALGSSMVWLGLAIGCIFWNQWSDHLGSRKIPAITGLAIQLVALVLMLLLPIDPLTGMALMFLCGVGSAGHMIAFSTAADVVEPVEIGTSAAFVNGAMFIMGGVLASLPAWMLPATTSGMTGYFVAFSPLLLLLCVAIIVAAMQRETAPKRRKV